MAGQHCSSRRLSPAVDAGGREAEEGMVLGGMRYDPPPPVRGREMGAGGWIGGGAAGGSRARAGRAEDPEARRTGCLFHFGQVKWEEADLAIAQHVRTAQGQGTVRRMGRWGR